MIETTNQTKLCGILGTPITHTLSPVMHSYMAQKMGIDMAYLAFDVLPAGFRAAMDGLKAMGACGLNITAPHKIRVMDELDVVSDEATRMNAVNTVVNQNGVWHGYNTDGEGFCRALELEGCAISGKHILVMGAGGSARSLCYKLAVFGAASISVTSRNADKIHIIGDMVEQYTNTMFFDSMDPTKQYDILINTTPLGMHPNEMLNPCSFMDMVDPSMVCCDLIYQPQKTVFLQEAEAKGAKVINGLGMLVMQGMLAFEHFCNLTLEKETLYQELMQQFHCYKI